MQPVTSQRESLSAVKLALAAQRLRGQGANRINEPVAIVGMACRLPGADTPEKFWTLLSAGKDLVGQAPSGRWSSLPAQVPCTGAFLGDFEWFDAEYFQLSDLECERLDPMHRILLETSWEALWDAGMEPATLAGSRVGVFTGIYEGQYATPSLEISAEARFDFASSVQSFAPARISFLLDVKGPCVVVNTACSSSLVALHLATRSLQAGESDAVIVGAVHLKLSAQEMFGPVLAGLYSSDGRTRSFDAAASGSAPGEGAIVLVLKRLSDAIANRHRVRAVVRGSATNHNGRTTAFSAPNGPAQAQVIRSALADAAVDASLIGYVEAHGTASLFGDAIEMEALMEVLGCEAGRRCAVGCVKTNLGHMEPASGLAGVLKTVLSFENNAIPPHLHLQRLNPYIQVDGSRFFFPSELIPWPRGSQPRWAGISSFSLTGSNAHTILEDAPLVPGCRAPIPPRAWKRRRFRTTPKPTADRAAEPETVSAFITREARRILQFDETERLDDDDSLFAAGLDLAGAMELRDAINHTAHSEFAATLVFDHPTIRELADFVHSTASPELPRPASKRFSLSSQQQAIWSLQKQAPASAAWQFAFCARVRPRPDRAALEQALQFVANKHSTLRLRIVDDGESLQRIETELLPAIEHADLSNHTEREILSRLVQDHQRPFDLIAGPPWRVSLYDHSPGESYLLFSIHELGCDRQSFEILWSDFQDAYAAAQNGSTVKAAAPASDYEQFVDEQAALAATSRGRQSAAYWNRQLRSAHSHHSGAGEPAWIEHRAFLPHDTLSHVALLAAEQNASLSMALLAAFRAVLFALTGQSELAICSCLSAPRGDRFSGVIGAFTSLLPFYLPLRSDETFLELLVKVRTALVEAIGKQPFPSFDQCVRLPRFTFVDGRAGAAPRTGVARHSFSQLVLGDCSLEPLSIAQQGSSPFELQVASGSGPLIALWRYDRLTSPPENVTVLASLYGTFLHKAANRPHCRIWQLLESAGYVPSGETFESVEL